MPFFLSRKRSASEKNNPEPSPLQPTPPITPPDTSRKGLRKRSTSSKESPPSHTKTLLNVPGKDLSPPSPLSPDSPKAWDGYDVQYVPMGKLTPTPKAKANKTDLASLTNPKQRQSILAKVFRRSTPEVPANFLQSAPKRLDNSPDPASAVSSPETPSTTFSSSSSWDVSRATTLASSASFISPPPPLQPPTAMELLPDLFAAGLNLSSCMWPFVLTNVCGNLPPLEEVEA
eukprot:g32542.t1